jgi:hypothetical protein
MDRRSLSGGRPLARPHIAPSRAWVLASLLPSTEAIRKTHNVSMASPVAQYMVSMGPSGQIIGQGSVADLVASKRVVMDGSEAINPTPEKPETAVKVADELNAIDGKLVLAEEKAEGRISLSSMRLFLDDVAGPWPVLFWLAYFLGGIATHVTLTLEPWYANA